MKFMDRIKILLGAEVVNEHLEAEIQLLKARNEMLEKAHTELLASYLGHARETSNFIKVVGNAIGNLDSRTEGIEQFCQYIHGKANAIEELIMEDKEVLPSMEGKKNTN